ncbi:HGxxPAAW family protein [Streptomyces sp. NPDC051976]|jgi:hypothetical protein|uniref:HGxxPAAW family protein n=1 Tax=Streptomyces sp. NPDC051976 TaxID=3154947 RepID=UPI003416C92C
MAGHVDHGHTPAAWTGSIIAFVGFCVAGVFMVAAQPVGFWAGMAVILLAPVVGGAMRLMGMGKKEEAHVAVARARVQEEAHANA